ncbi:MAG: DNA replication and repair protein RecF [Candidatus Saccharibacteria bacterium]
MITNIRLQQFRSYQDDSFEFEEGVNVIVGPNASGKTNILEAILLATQGKSYRAKDAEMIRQGQPWARIDADIVSKHRVVKLELLEGVVKKSFDLDDKKLSRLGASTRLPVVLFEPNHLLMLGGSPDLRRAFLDLLIDQTTPEYGTTLNKYKRALLQRNRLLKSGRAAANQLFAWDIRLSELGAQIVTARHQMIDEINKHFTATYNQLAGHKNSLSLRYSLSVEPEAYGSYLLKKLEKDLDLDLLRGFTSSGPHREDILFVFDGQPLANVASRGEVRTALLALKIIELHIIESHKGVKPMLLLDDVFSELDGARRKSLTSFIKSYQTFITTTDADVVIKHFAKQCNIIPL